MKRKFLRLTLLLCSILFVGCLPGGETGKGGHTITVYGFSIMKEAPEKEIYPAFAVKWKRETGEDIHFVSSFAGSETVTNQILHSGLRKTDTTTIEFTSL